MRHSAVHRNEPLNCTNQVGMTVDLKDYLHRQKESIDQALISYIQRLCPSDHLIAPMEYAVMAGGKRLRPVLCKAAAAAIGGRTDEAMPAACALEMIHTYSLIHDDLPALDNDMMRRGQTTSHIKFGEATAILSGDAFLNMAYEVLSEAGTETDGTRAGKWMSVIRIISAAAGCRGMLQGQARDLAYEGIALGHDELKALHRLKTGALITSAVHSGAVIAEGDRRQLDALLQYADNIGLAFQVVDDVLNVTGDPDIMGKAVGTDEARGKNTYPALMGLDASRRYARTLVEDALQAVDIFDNKADPLRAIAAYIIDRNR
jgi:geranylgeranyl diphosphate synthase type II